MDVPKHYDAKKAEVRWQNYWEKEGVYAFDPDSKKEAYSVDTPPPYASAGHLHIGHALHYTQFEIVARIMRQLGFNVYFPPCFDNNGLPTEKYVEEEFGIDKNKTTRAEFRKLCLKESKKVERIYSDKVFRALGHSYDWGLLYTTIDPEAQRVAQTAFAELYRKGDCYRAEEPTIWCTKHQTALAQAEVEDLERQTALSYIDFDTKQRKITIATTRPELLSSCVGVFVHPEDKRYKRLIGGKASVPLFCYDVPVMADEKVDMDFGTGIVMVCTFGDTTDIEWWKKHKLPLKISITEDGRLNEQAAKFEGMALKDAKKAIISELNKQGRLKKQEAINQVVGSCWRCSTPVEFIVTKQWFIKTLKYKKELIQQGRKIKWHPAFMRARFEDWTKNLSWDWCISRQRFYGVPIPAWYCKKCGKVFVEDKNLPVDPTETKPAKSCKCGSKVFVPEEDVFDTWMTSSNTPEVACRWLEKPALYKKLAPMSLRPQSHDIIRTWAFYTILKSFLLFKRIPWKDVIIGTFVLDEKGKGMSKSKGNVVWADEILKKYSVDAFRYWVGTASLGSDLPFKEKDLVAGQKFLTKLWNASRFSLSHLRDYEYKNPAKPEVMDKWVLTKLSALVEDVKRHYTSYNIAEAKKKTENFFWHLFCDNYLEIVKDRLYNSDSRGKQAKESAQYGLYTALLAILKLIAPITPHITEEIYHLYFAGKEGKKSIHISDWPRFDKKMVDKEAESAGDLAIELIAAVRRFKSENKLPLTAEIKKLTVNCDEAAKKRIRIVEKDLKATAKIKEVAFGKGDTEIRTGLRIGIFT
jgi:valyl-tRNA synthetase